MTLSITLPALHPAQHAVCENTARFRVLVTGRRWGKTYLGVALCYEAALQGKRVWWIAPSYPMTRPGWNLIRALALQIPGATLNKAERIVTVPGGGTIQVRSGHEPDTLRGEGLDLAVLDECAYMKMDVWTASIRPALSDRRGRALFISTPKGGNWFADMYTYASKKQDDTWAAFHFPSAANPYLDMDEIESAREVQSSRLFRQEYMAEILLDVPGALWTRAMIDGLRADETLLPAMSQIVVAIDPAVTSTSQSSETGMIVVSFDRVKGYGYVLDDLSGRYSPDKWARIAIQAYHDYQADRIVAEVNNGGDLVESVLRTADPHRRVSYSAVRATRGKYTRAEPVAALYEQRRIYHAGLFGKLEDQLCTWVPGEPSPDRLDALVWGFTHLMLKRRGGGNIQ
jgi:phage terminase large subunit-like protein